MITFTDSNDHHPVDAPRGRPSAAQLEALHRAVARGRELLPFMQFPKFIWFHDPLCRNAGLTRYYDVDISPTMVYLNDQLNPDELYRVVLHELRHVGDADIVRCLSRAAAERRAEEFVARAIGSSQERSEIMNTNSVAARRRALVARGHAINNLAERQRRHLTASEQREFDALLFELEGLDAVARAPRRPPLLAELPRHWTCRGAGSLQPLDHVPGFSKCNYCGTVRPTPTSN
jgi:hypothetical protein